MFGILRCTKSYSHINSKTLITVTTGNLRRERNHTPPPPRRHPDVSHRNDSRPSCRYREIPMSGLKLRRSCTCVRPPLNVRDCVWFIHKEPTVQVRLNSVFHEGLLIKSTEILILGGLYHPRLLFPWTDWSVRWYSSPLHSHFLPMLLNCHCSE